MLGITAIKTIPFGKFYDVPSFQITLAFTPGSDVVYPSGIKTLARTREYLQHEFSIDLLEKNLKKLGCKGEGLHRARTNVLFRDLTLSGRTYLEGVNPG